MGPGYSIRRLNLDQGGQVFYKPRGEVADFAPPKLTTAYLVRGNMGVLSQVLEWVSVFLRSERGSL